MKKKIFAASVCVVTTCAFLTACSLPFELPFGKKGEPEDEATTEVSSDEAEPVADEAAVTQEEAPVVSYMEDIAAIEDPYSGIFGVGNAKVDPSCTYPDVVPNLSGYHLVYTNIDGNNSVEEPDIESIPNDGVFSVGFAPEGITNVSDPSVIVFEFAVPYRSDTNPNRKNENKVKLGDYRMQDVRFNVYTSDGTFTGNSLTVPGYHQAVLTKQDMISAYGGPTGEYLTATMSTAVKFFKPDTCLKDVTGTYDNDENLTGVELSYDINYGIDTSALQSVMDPADINFDISMFSDFIDNQLSPGQYYGFYQDIGQAKYLFVANADAVDQDTYGAYEATVYVADDAGNVVNYADIASSAPDKMPIKVDARGKIYCAAPGQVACLSVNKETQQLDVNSSAVMFTDDAGNTMYNYGGDDTDDDSQYKDMTNQYDKAIQVSFYAK